MTSTDPEDYLAVLKASYDYDAQSEEEISIAEGQILFLLERTDEDWWKVKIKPDSQDEDSPSGLVPAAYVEQADPSKTVKALYDYEARAPGELTIAENDVLLVFALEDEWILVQSEGKDRAGFVPETYVEEADDGEAASTAPQIIIPDSPPRPSAPYVDPAERVASSKAAGSSTSADKLESWSVSEVDRKGKKKKGSLVIGSGQFFFASESDKAAVQKYRSSSITDVVLEKSKHIHISATVAGEEVELHISAGGSSEAQAILAKLKLSRIIAQESRNSLMSAPTPPPEEMRVSPASALRIANSAPKNANVRFAPAGPMVIPPSPEPSDDGEEEPAEEHPAEYENDLPDELEGSNAAVALYDFAADGDDELTITEGETLLILEQDGEEWWKVRNMQGDEGVVPASYVETVQKLPDEDRAAAVALAAKKKKEQEIADRAVAERIQREEAERRDAAEAAEAAEVAAAAEAEEAEAEAAAAAAAAKRSRDEERARKEKEARRKAKEDARRRDEEERVAQEGRRAKEAAEEEARSRRESERKRATASSSNGDAPRPPRSDSKPPAGKSRIWHDRSGQFRVEAVFLGMNEDKLRLHKSNGVVIEVDSSKMSDDDLRYIGKLSKKPKRDDDDDVPLGTKTRSARQSSTSQPKKGPQIDWFEFFLSAGCDVDDCTRYASNFERDKMDASILPDITESTLRSLGLREGDIIRVNKAIAQRAPKKVDPNLPHRVPETKDVPATPAPNLFASGPGGQLKAPRRGRPTPTKSMSSQNVDLAVISTASNQIQRTASPGSFVTTSPADIERPPRSSSALTTTSRFDDDAWTNRPSSTKPMTPQPAASASASVASRAASAPPVAPLIDTQAASPATTNGGGAPSPSQGANGAKNLANTTEADIFDQLARLSALKPAAPPPPTSPAVATPPAASPPPPAAASIGFRQGMGMGNSPIPMGQMSPPIPSPSPAGVSSAGGPRGPYAPVPANQSLLQPLVPTTTGFSGFVPLRPNPTGAFPPFSAAQQTNTFSNLSAPSFLSSQPTGFQSTIPPFIPPQQTGFQPQPTGFAPQLQSQPTGFQSASPFGQFSLPSAPGPVPSNPTGMPGGNGMFQPPIQNQFTGFQVPQNAPPLPQFNANPSHIFAQMKQNSDANNTAPANVFAQMKSGAFANDSAPQTAGKYDALRPQPTGWGYQNGY